jgi:cell fate regulator YaaT (PSP1 superfamily)
MPEQADRPGDQERRPADPGRSGGRRDQGPPPPPPAPDEPLVIVCFKGQRKDYFHNRRSLALQVGQFCVVEVDRGRDLGQITYIGPGRPAWWQHAVYQGVLGLGTAQDLARLPELRREEREARDIAGRRIASHGLEMDLVGVERRWDRKKLTFYFLADGRVDFRALVRDLAGIFRTRIELRQIGVRDEARLKGGLGICGRTFCCATFLGNFVSVGLRMAKDQQLALNQAKLSGPCGRLRCCLAYEHPIYQDALRRMPKLGSLATWQERQGKVRKLDPLQAKVTLQLVDDGQELVEVPVTELAFTVTASANDEPASPVSGSNGSPARNRSRRRGGRSPATDPPDRDRT